MAEAALVTIPAGPFLMGAEYSALSEDIRQSDRQKSLGLGAVLSSTPPHWVEVPEFSIEERMVSNGGYHAFWTAPHPQESNRLLVDDAEIWEYVWDQYPLAQVRVPLTGSATHLSENYETCQNAADALLMSYAYEAQRVVVGHHIPAFEPGFDEKSTSVVRLFTIARFALAKALGTEPPQLPPAMQDLVRQTEELPTDISRISARVDERYLSVRATTPLQTILSRLARWAVQTEDPLLASRLLSPLSWPDDMERALQDGRGLFRSATPFSELPVVGISLYEASAYAAWMRLKTGEPYDLPSEAEWEKAFSWCTENHQLDPSAKHIYPWQTDNHFDFNQWFSREGHRVEQAQKRSAGYQRLLDSTARTTCGGKLYQGLGFGWQWTRERFNELERKYNRFDHVGWLSREIDGIKVYEYTDCTDHSCRYMVVRGAPDQLGGPGTVTRRFALSPLRGTRECGFRCVISSAGDM